MATVDGATERDSVREDEWKKEVEEVSYQELNRIPNIHILKKPSWYLRKVPLDVDRIEYEPVRYYALEKNEEAPAEIETIEYKQFDPVGGFWISFFSIPVILLLILPLLAVLALTLFHFEAAPDSMTPSMFKNAAGDVGKTYALAGCWALALVSFVPWSVTICRLESFLMKYLR